MNEFVEFAKRKKAMVDWSDSTWSPVTGCLHGCEYCYARKIAHRYAEQSGIGKLHELNCRRIVSHRNDEGGWDPEYACSYPFDFDPTFHRYRLDIPERWRRPRNIFVCSMADLFGDWVPDKWITEVLEACDRAPQHRYLFLTKNPVRVQHPTVFYTSHRRFPNIAETWFGQSITKDNGGYTPILGIHTFVSIEPILERLSVGLLSLILRTNEWVIVGAETGNRKGKVIPKKEWIDDIAFACKASGTPIFMKKSLRELMGDDFRQEYPWEV